MKPKTAEDKALAPVLRQLETEVVGNLDEGVAIAADKPGAAEIEPFSRRNLFGVGPAADTVRSFDDVIAQSKPR
ncbi:MAG: hypothetical protein Kilf2KO_42070 [Rhodospirillales bacterium]